LFTFINTIANYDCSNNSPFLSGCLRDTSSLCRSTSRRREGKGEGRREGRKEGGRGRKKGKGWREMKG